MTVKILLKYLKLKYFKINNRSCEISSQQMNKENINVRS